MKKIFTVILILTTLLITGCFSEKNSSTELANSQKNLVKRTLQSYSKVYFRGTPNNWSLPGTEMTLVSDNTWETTQTFGTDNPRFKIAVSTDWSVAFPAQDYLITQGAGQYKIKFVDTTKIITVTKVTTQETLTVSVTSSTIIKGDTTFALPAIGNYSNGTSVYGVNLLWSPALNVNTVGITEYTATYGNATVKFTLTVNNNSQFLSSFSKVYFRGTPNAWSLTGTEMTLVSDYTWETTQTFGTDNPRFKIAVSTDWSMAYPAQDYLIAQGAGQYKIKFVDTTKSITVTKIVSQESLTVPSSSATITKGNTTFTLPATGTYTNGTTVSTVPLTWTPALNLNTIGTTEYTAVYGNVSVKFNLTIKNNIQYQSIFSKVYFRGTANSWSLTGTEMYLAENNIWETVQTFGTDNPRFKVAVSTDWSQAYPAQDYLIKQGAGSYRITFNEVTKLINVNKIYQTTDVNVLVVSFNPIVTSKGNKYLNEVITQTISAGSNPKDLAATIVPDMKESTGGRINYVIKQWTDENEMPRSTTGFQYTVDGYISDLEAATAWGGQYWNYPGWKNTGFGITFDYNYYITKYNLVSRVNSGEIQQVWFFLPPLSGADSYESQMAGQNAYWCNSPPIIRSDVKPFMMFNFNYERGVGEALEDFGHAMESIMEKVYGRRDYSIPYTSMNKWEKFATYDKVTPGKSGAGNVHFSPNSAQDYDWGNSTPVTSNYAEWMEYPNSTNDKRTVSKADWGNGDIRLHHKWWFSCIPKADGIDSEGIQNNWWGYFADPQTAIR